jgi:hypothetical protein
MSGQVLTIHGIAPGVVPDAFSFRNLCDADAMHRYLAAVPPFVSIDDALAGRGNALTIDDAIRGAADAALLARRHGHAVSLFVNPAQVEAGTPYAFLLLNVLLDSLNRRRCVFDGTGFPTKTFAQRQRLRRRIKARLCALTSEQERLDVVAGLADEWDVKMPAVPPHFRTIGRDELVTLRDAGVSLENHGWSHSDHTSLSPAESIREIREGRAWLERELGVAAAHFAAPFGDALPTPEAAAICPTWLTASEVLPAGPLSAPVFNRTFLELPVSSPSSAGRGWWSGWRRW